MGLSGEWRQGRWCTCEIVLLCSIEKRAGIAQKVRPHQDCQSEFPAMRMPVMQTPAFTLLMLTPCAVSLGFSRLMQTRPPLGSGGSPPENKQAASGRQNSASRKHSCASRKRRLASSPVPSKFDQIWLPFCCFAALPRDSPNYVGLPLWAENVPHKCRKMEENCRCPHKLREFRREQLHSYICLPHLPTCCRSFKQQCRIGALG